MITENVIPAKTNNWQRMEVKNHKKQPAYQTGSTSFNPGPISDILSPAPQSKSCLVISQGRSSTENLRDATGLEGVQIDKISSKRSFL